MSAGGYLFVSDLHLDAQAPSAASQFEEFLQQHAVHAAALYVLGDLFEAWVGDDDDEALRDRVCRALKRLTDTGVACFVVRGNRDFLFGAGFEARTGSRLLPDPVLTQLYGRSVLISHGDLLCTDDLAYQEFRSMVRRPDWQARFLALPLATRRAVADQARAGSRTHTQRTAPRIMDVNENAVTAAFRLADAEVIVHGHTHRPAVHEYAVDGRQRTRIVLGDWYDQGSYLTWDENGFELHSLQR